MLEKAILLVVATLGIAIWWFKRRRIPSQTITEQDSETKGESDGNKDELDDVDATEVVATWNLLNPP